LCGEFQIDNPKTTTAEITDLRKPYLSMAARQAYEGGRPVALNFDNVADLAAVHAATTVSQKVERTLQFLACKCKHPGIDGRANFFLDFPAVDCVDAQEMAYYAFHLCEQKLLRAGELPRASMLAWAFTLSIEGWQVIEPSLAPGGEPDRCFVAMWFDDGLDSAYNSGFVKAIEECGFKPYRVKEDPTNKGITDRILSEIRRAHFIVADFTGQRQSVYYEAGFAHGIGREVIACCQDGHVTNLAFDTRHLGHVVWKDATDLRTKLRDSIRANIIPKR